MTWCRWRSALDDDEGDVRGDEDYDDDDDDDDEANDDDDDDDGNDDDTMTINDEGDDDGDKDDGSSEVFGQWPRGELLLNLLTSTLRPRDALQLYRTISIQHSTKKPTHDCRNQQQSTAIRINPRSTCVVRYSMC